jgi:formamidopyrimidine-DNA glycosylase
MPELPEVEIIRQGLEPILLGKTIESVSVKEKRLRSLVVIGDFEALIVGQRISAIERRAKFMIWKFGNGACVVIHLGMSGRIGVFSEEMPEEKHTHLIFHISDGKQIRYRDPRRFGLIEVVPAGPLDSYFRFRELGVEPLSADLSGDYLWANASKSKKNIKAFLMDGKAVVGLGNIYVAEALFYAGIHPLRLAASLSREECERLRSAIQKVLQEAIKKGGTTLNDYRNAQGEPGLFQASLAVYDRENEECFRCKMLIERVVLNGRSTYYCPACQK